MTIDDAPPLCRMSKRQIESRSRLPAHRRRPLYPDLPTVAASGCGYESVASKHLCACPKLLPRWLKRRNQEIVRVSTGPMQGKFLGLDGKSSPIHRDFAAILKKEWTAWADDYRLGLRVDNYNTPGRQSHSRYSFAGWPHAHFQCQQEISQRCDADCPRISNCVAVHCIQPFASLISDHHTPTTSQQCDSLSIEDNGLSRPICATSEWPRTYRGYALDGVTACTSPSPRRSTAYCSYRASPHGWLKLCASSAARPSRNAGIDADCARYAR